MPQHDFQLTAVFDDIEIFNGTTLFGERFPSGACVRSRVFAKNQNFGRHAGSSWKIDALASQKIAEQLPHI